MSADRNLLYGMLALHNGLITRDQLIAATTAWMARKETPLGGLLRELGALTDDDQRLLDGLVARQVQRHGDAAKSLASLRVESSVRHELSRLGDADVQASLAPQTVAPDEWATNAPAAFDRPGTRYRRLRPHARGGLGEVSVTLDEELKREVALKEIQERFADHPDSRGRFTREAEITGHLEHPGIVPVYGLGTYPDGRPYYAMRFIRGESMHDAIARFHKADQGKRDAGERSMALRELLTRFVAVCESVAYAHSRGVVHRDLKPANVMLGEYGETLVVDWGLARILEQKEGEASTAERPLPAGTGSGTAPTEMGQVVGTPAYMPPEQATGQLNCVGSTSDVFSLGATLYHLLTGQPPYSGDDVLGQARVAEAEPARRRRVSVPAALEAVCQKAMRAEPQDRYATARRLADEVRHWMADEPVTAYREPWPARAARWARKHRGAVTTAAFGLVALLAVSTVALAVVSGLNRKLEAANESLTQSTERLTASEDETKRERDIAVAVNTFLQYDLLGQADIGNQMLVSSKEERNPNIRVAELLDRAAKEIDGKFSGQAETEAAIRRTVGDAYFALGMYEEAMPQLKRSMAMFDQKLGADHPDTLMSKSNLAVLYNALGKHDEAESICLEVLRLRERTLGTDHISTLTSRGNLASLYHSQGKHARAEALFLEVLRQKELTLGTDHYSTLTTRNNLAALYLAQRKYAQAQALCQVVVKQSERKLGPDHPLTLASMNNLAQLYQDQWMHAQAEALLSEVLRQREKKLGADHPDTLTSRGNLARLYRAQGKHAKAEPLLLEVVSKTEQRMGADHPATLNNKNSLAVLYWSMKRLDRSIPLFEQLLPISEKKMGADHPATLRNLANLGVNYRDAGRYTDAIRCLEVALARAKKRPGELAELAAWVQGNLIRAYEAANQNDKAELYYRVSLEQARKQFGSDDVRTTSAMAHLAQNLHSQKKHAEAEKLLRDCLRIWDKAQPDEFSPLYVRSLLGEALLGQKKYADAEPLLLKGYEGMQQRQDKIPPQFRAVRLKEALERLVALYDATGDKAKAAKYRAELAALPKEPAKK